MKASVLPVLDTQRLTLRPVALTDAHFLGYNCVLVEDCCGTTSPDFCAEATLWNIKKCFGFVTTSAEVISAMPKKATT